MENQIYKIYIDKGSLSFFDAKNYQNIGDSSLCINFYDFIEDSAEQILKNKTYRSKNILIVCQNLEQDYQKFIKLFEPVFAAGGIVENEFHEILFIQRNKKWDLPKGHIELNELAIEGALREVREECGLQELTLLSQKPLLLLAHIYFEHDRTPAVKYTSWYPMKASKNSPTQPQKEEGITAIEWIGSPYHKVLKSRTYSSIIDIVNLLLGA